MTGSFLFNRFIIPKTKLCQERMMPLLQSFIRIILCRPPDENVVKAIEKNSRNFRKLQGNTKEED
jgi:hypothetical protein